MEIEFFITPTCAKCGKITQFGQYCSACKQKIETNLAGLIVAASYDAGPVKEMIHHLKYSGFSEFVDLLVELIYQRLLNKLPKGNIEVVPVPLHRSRESMRGFNQAELIARQLSKKLNLTGGNFLRRTKNTEPQVTLSGQKRRENLINSFICEEPKEVEGKTILLIDDVTTTGTTLNECARVLKDAGAKSVWGVVVAKRI